MVFIFNEHRSLWWIRVDLKRTDPEERSVFGNYSVMGEGSRLGG